MDLQAPTRISSLSPWRVCSSNFPLEGRAQWSSGPPHLPAGSTEGEDRALGGAPSSWLTWGEPWMWSGWSG